MLPRFLLGILQFDMRQPIKQSGMPALLGILQFCNMIFLQSQTPYFN